MRRKPRKALYVVASDERGAVAQGSLPLRASTIIREAVVAIADGAMCDTYSQRDRRIARRVASLMEHIEIHHGRYER